jgi:acetolactate synthase-1/3 small subunit
VTLQNEVGALTRVAGLFSTRGYNIESLSVAPTDDPTVSRLTLVTTGNDAVIQQISNQLLKLVDVVDVEDVTREEHFERELLLIKVKAKATQVGALWSASQRAGGRVLWDAGSSRRSRTSARCSKSCAAARSRSRRARRSSSHDLPSL